MLVKLDLTNKTLEYIDSTPFIQGEDTRNVLRVAVPTTAVSGSFNMQVAYVLQNGRTTIKMSNTGIEDETINIGEDLETDYNVVYFAIPKIATSLFGNLVATLIVTTSSNEVYKFNVLNNVLERAHFEEWEEAFADSELLEEVQNMQTALGTVQTGLANRVQYADIVDALNSTATNKPLSANQGKVLNDGKVNKTQTINGHALSSDVVLDKTDIGLGNVDNTSDADKPVSNATQLALDAKVSISNIVDDLVTESTTKPLSANQGKVLKGYADNLQSQIDGINAGQNLADIVANLTDLEDLDTSKLQVNDKVQVLVDSNHANASTVYNWSGTAWQYIGKYGQDGYTKSEANALLATKQNVIDNNNKLSSDLVDDTDATNKFVTASEKAQITANTNAISGIKDGTSIDSFSDVESALATKANTSDVYAKSEVYTKAEAETLINAKCKETADNLRWELGTYDLGVETVNGTTMLLPTPANTIQATMVRVDGKSEVSENLIVLNDVAETTINGITYKVENGVITLNGTATANINLNFYFVNELPIGTYSYNTFKNATTSDVSMQIRGTDGTVKNINTVSQINGTETFTSTIVGNRWYIYIPSGTNATFTFKPMLVKGSTAPTEFKKGYTGIHNLELTGIKSEGSNLFDGETELGTIDVATGQNVVGTAALRCKNYQNVMPNKTYTLNYIYRAFYYDSNFNYLGYSTVTDVSGVGKQFTTPYNCAYVRFNVVSEYGTTYLNNIRLNLGSTLLAYVPYIAPTTKNIDLTTIEDSGGNKLFEDDCLREGDYITPTEQKSVRNVKVLNETLIYLSDDGKTAGYTIGGKPSTSCIIIYNGSLSINIPTSLSGAGNVVFTSNEGHTRTEWDNAINGTTVEYERATHLTSNTNLSQLVKFEAYSNGSITLVNTNNQDTTSTFKYLKEVAK